MRPNISLILKQISFFIGIVNLSGCSAPLKPTEVQPAQDSVRAWPRASTETQTPKPVQQPMIQSKPQVKPTPMAALDYQAQGLASWYTLEEHGNKTASGILYDMYGMTAAHASLPLLTPVEVKHLRKRVVVTITDRLSDPKVLIKLSNEAAQRLQLLDTPHPKVEVRYLPTFSNS